MKQDDVIIYDLADFSEFKKENFNTVKKSPVINLIREYTVEGNFIRTWNNIASVSNAFGVTYSKIGSCLRGKLLTVKDRIFLNGTDKIEDRLLLIKNEQKRLELIKSVEEEYARLKEIEVYTSSGEFLRNCSSIAEAAMFYQLPNKAIYNNIEKRSLVNKGLCFLRNDEDIADRLKQIKNRKTHKKNL